MYRRHSYFRLYNVAFINWPESCDLGHMQSYVRSLIATTSLVPKDKRCDEVPNFLQTYKTFF